VLDTVPSERLDVHILTSSGRILVAAVFVAEIGWAGLGASQDTLAPAGYAAVATVLMAVAFVAMRTDAMPGPMRSLAQRRAKRS